MFFSYDRSKCHDMQDNRGINKDKVLKGGVMWLNRELPKVYNAMRKYYGELRGKIHKIVIRLFKLYGSKYCSTKWTQIAKLSIVEMIMLRLMCDQTIRI